MNKTTFESVFNPFFTEIDRLFKPTTAPSFPFHNVISEKNGRYRIELAVAGFTQDELKILLEKNVLIVRGSKKQESSSSPPNYIHHGIAGRQFQTEFALGRSKVEVSETYLENGILTIIVTYPTPANEEAQLIPIGKKVSEQGKQLLTE